ncbi:MAG: hypothetical protein ABWY93_22680 [Mycobacterium sp.]
MHELDTIAEPVVNAFWLLSCVVLAGWAAFTQWRLTRLRRANRVAVSVISHWRRLAMGAPRKDGNRAAYLSKSQLAERIAAQPLSDDQNEMVRRVLAARRNQRGRR